MPVHSLTTLFLVALALGFVSGMRSMLAVAVLSLVLWRRPELAPTGAPGSWLARSVVAVALPLAAIGELVADKLPHIPDRIAPGPLLARAVTGAVAGATAVQIGRGVAWHGAVMGVLGAMIGAFTMFTARRRIGERLHLRDPIVAVGEDVLALLIAAIAVGVLAGA